MLFALAYPDAKIIALEPDMHNFRLALMNTARFPNVHVVHAGLWSKTAHIGMFASEVCVCGQASCTCAVATHFHRGSGAKCSGRFLPTRPTPCLPYP